MYLSRENYIIRPPAQLGDSKTSTRLSAYADCLTTRARHTKCTNLTKTASRVKFQEINTKKFPWLSMRPRRVSRSKGSDKSWPQKEIQSVRSPKDKKCKITIPFSIYGRGGGLRALGPASENAIVRTFRLVTSWRERYVWAIRLKRWKHGNKKMSVLSLFLRIFTRWAEI